MLVFVDILLHPLKADLVLLLCRLHYSTSYINCLQAGKILGQYCIDNAETFRNKCILELGCGLGLTGIATVIGCKPKHYCFTDVHFEVLSYVVKNIKINFGSELDTKCEESNGASDLQFQGTYNDVTVSVINLPWEKNEFSTIYEHFDPDYILAAGNLIY